MEVKVTAPKSWLRELEIEVSPEELYPKFEDAYKRYQQQIRMDGFRRGKVPLEIIKKRFGEAIEGEVIEKELPEFFKKAVSQERLKPVDTAHIEEVSYQRGKSLKFKAKVEVEPDVEVVGYKGIKVKRAIREIGPEDVNNALQDLRQAQAVVTTVDGEAEEGHYILADIQLLDRTGVPVVGKKWENYFRLGAGALGEDFEEQLVGVKLGEERRVTFCDPEHVDESEEPELYAVRIKRIEDRKLPELDDEFAKDVGEHNTLEELKAALKKDLELRAQEEAEERLQESVIDEVVKNNNFEVPPSMVENCLKALIKTLRKNSPENIDEQMLRERYRPEVIRVTKWHILRDKIAEIEGIEVTEEEIERQIAQIAEAKKMAVEKVRAHYSNKERLRSLKTDLLERKVVDFIEENAIVEDEYVRAGAEEESKIVAV